MIPTDRHREVTFVLLVTFLLNLVVATGKLVVGTVVHSLSMVADGIHSLVDASSNIVGFVSVHFASKPADEDHPYGHQKIEVVASLGIALMMGVTCVEILRTALGRFQDPSAIPEPTLLAFGVMGATMAVNAWVSWYERKKGRELNSPVLTADSAHTNSDILASFTVLAALAGAKMGWGFLDLVAAAFVVFIIARAAWEIVNHSLQVLSDRIMLDPARVAGVVRKVPGVISCHKVRSRGMPGSVFVDLHIQVSPKLTTLKSHALTHQVMARVKEAIPEISEVFVHTEPAKPEDYRHRGRKS
jgi:cation diffusion facilitator family transporter